MRERLKLGLVGAGAIAQSYIKAVEDCPTAEWTGIADVRVEAAEAAAETMGCQSYATHEDLLNAGCDAVIICTPPATHPEVALFFMERGVPVLCEKPLAVDVAGAIAI